MIESKAPKVSRVFWSVADQALSSGTNFLLILVAARELDARSFGSFSIALAIYIIVLGSSRGLNTDALVIRYTRTGDGARRDASAAAGGASFVGGAVIGVAVAIAGLATHGDLRASLLSLGVSLPGLMLQDAWRYAFFCSRQPSRAAAVDFTWALCQSVFLGGLILRGDVRVAELVLAWGVAAMISAIAGAILLRREPKLMSATHWWAQHSDLGPRYMLQFWALHGSSQLVALGLGAIVGLEAAGALRGAQALFGPLTVLIVGVRLMLMSEGSARDHGPGLKRSMTIASFVLAGLAALWGLVLVLLPDHVGRSILGDTWMRAEALIVPLALAVIAVGATEGAISGLRVLAAAKRSLRIQFTTGSMTVVAGLAGALADGPYGASVGIAASGWLGLGFWWANFVKQREPMV